ncbi:four helix bundle protein [candidate division WWE3 bacterium CG10_big_fil_rev_8_21_14_0_10_32_10]|uniref:Four helix bundle protein n=1 Tax=candidate division WWE3 bacterium CG10_big_fil_rev_8_21_14_0_10_32_10 TaxID=1975090 RepID=A0A2H0RAN3_UNCKA|nr:MAG: four helix bundle protein [candidate division WWE3 bacterium CG10_big_fil_rev_8_21_14_0_10_32_10]
MSYFKSVEDIEIWNLGINLCVDLYEEIEKSTPFKQDFALKDQVKRSSISIPSNVAEGFERYSNNEFIRFLYISKGSCGELRTQLLISKRLGYIDVKEYDEFNKRCVTISKKLSKLILFLKKKTF